MCPRSLALAERDSTPPKTTPSDSQLTGDLWVPGILGRGRASPHSLPPVIQTTRNEAQRKKNLQLLPKPDQLTKPKLRSPPSMRLHNRNSS
jgi:hypothetical protein